MPNEPSLDIQERIRLVPLSVRLRRPTRSNLILYKHRRFEEIFPSPRYARWSVTFTRRVSIPKAQRLQCKTYIMQINPVDSQKPQTARRCPAHFIQLNWAFYPYATFIFETCCNGYRTNWIWCRVDKKRRLFFFFGQPPDFLILNANICNYSRYLHRTESGVNCRQILYLQPTNRIILGAIKQKL